MLCVEHIFNFRALPFHVVDLARNSMAVHDGWRHAEPEAQRACADSWTFPSPLNVVQWHVCVTEK